MDDDEDSLPLGFVKVTQRPIGSRLSRCRCEILLHLQRLILDCGETFPTCFIISIIHNL